MANYTTLYRDNGKTEETRKLQQSLQEKGYYQGSVDGIYGQQTESAVRQYQSDNNLDVDGIAGEKTLTSLYGSPTTQQPANQNGSTTVTGGTTGGSKLQGTYDEQYARTYEELMGTEGFSYDLNGDPLWQQYKDSYTAQGKLAAMDNMGQAMGMTGGFGSSYAQGVGQQTYQGYLQQMNDRVPELYKLAMQKYDADLALAKDKFYAAGTMADREYAHEQDASDNQKAAYNDLATRIQNGHTPTDEELAAAGMTRGEADYIAQTASDPDGAYNRLVTRIQNGHTPTDDELAAAGMTREEADYIASTVADTNIYDDYTYDETTGNTTGPNGEIYTADQVKQAQAFLGLPQTGVWDASCISRASAYNYSDLSTVLVACYEDSKNDPSAGYQRVLSYTTGTYFTMTPYGETMYTDDQVKKAQAYLDLEQTGIWDAQCEKAAQMAGFTKGRGLDEAYAKAAANPNVSGGGNGNSGDITDYTRINEFHNSIHSESEHDAVMRDMYGSYQQYVAEQIEKSDLSVAEKAYLISYYDIQESDTNYKPR